MTATLRALLFLQRICTLVCLCLFREFPSVAEQSSCRSTDSTSLPSYKPYLSFSPYSCLPSASLFFTVRLSLTCSLSYLFALSVSVSPCLGLPSSPSPHRPVCAGSPDMHHTYCINSHRSWIIYSSLTDCYEKCLLRAEPGWTDNTPTHKTMQGCTHSPQLQISGLNMR